MAKIKDSVFSQVAIVKGLKRREIIRKSLELISDKIRNNLQNRQIIIKPKFVSASILFASTHVDQIRGILDFLAAFYKNE